MVACDHELSLTYFAQSIRVNGTYIAYACDGDEQGFVNGRCHSVSYMGYDAIKPTHNTKYYLHMSDMHPFEGLYIFILLFVGTCHKIELKLSACLGLRFFGGGESPRTL